MTVTAHVFPSATQNIATKTENWNNSDTLKVGLAASGTFNWVAATEAYTTVAQFLANAGSGGGGALTEVSTSGTNYARLALSSVAVSQSGLYVTLTVGTNPQWTNATFSAVYAFFYDAVVDTDDTTRKLICYWDFGGAQSCSSGTFTLTMGTANSVANSLVQFTHS